MYYIKFSWNKKRTCSMNINKYVVIIPTNEYSKSNIFY